MQDAIPRHLSPIGLAILLAVDLSGCRTLESDLPSAPESISRPTFVLIDTDEDRKVSPKEMAAYEHQEGLAEVDLDDDRRVSPSEWKAARPTSPVGDTLFASLDMNRDGFLAEDEAVSHIIGKIEFQAAFKTMDTNGDGLLIWEEYAAGDAASLNVPLFSAGASPVPIRTAE